MEAKGTVMKGKALYKAVAGFDYNPSCDGPFYLPIGAEKIAKVQAEISFKAGQDQSLRELLAYAQSGELDKRFAEIKRAGVKAAVEWVDKFYEGKLLLSSVVGKAKLKEWGIK